MSHSACNDPTCATMVEGRVGICPKCGGPMRSVGESPIRGIVLLVIGLFLLALMGTITSWMAPTLTRPGVEIEGSSFSGTAEQGRMILGLFGLILLFGLVAAVNGLFMIVTRRQSMAFVFVTLGLAALIVIVGFVFIGTA